ncbi:hypothetical protein [Azorhizobium oxalatiphilum]|uniref:hypothetical protein n=1 Tax=Azorhizobium oxalatiphilum TaxID=980631 RepID=UPI001663B80A|nr:hypothetical protein [Azorhizobium oxalatiphilum]
MVWLELTNTDHMVGGNSQIFVTALIGAVTSPRGREAIKRATAAHHRHVVVPVGDQIGARVSEFQRAICADWAGFTPATAERYAKGTTFGTDISGPSFIMKALKTGFDAIGASISAYDGIRARAFTVDDVLGYLAKRALAVPPLITDPALTHDFVQMAPDPAGKLTEDKPRTQLQGDARNIAPIYSNKHKTHSRENAYGKGIAPAPFKPVVAYGFRGDTRPPSEIRAVGGFLPNYTRDFSEQPIIGQQRDAFTQALDLPTFLGDPTLGGYISTGSSYAITKSFASTSGGLRTEGWVYVCFVEGGFRVPAKGTIPASDKHPEIKIPFAEHEIAMPGMLDWDDIVACRRVTKTGTFEGNIFIRKVFAQHEWEACMKVFFLLSGASQGDH